MTTPAPTFPVELVPLIPGDQQDTWGGFLNTNLTRLRDAVNNLKTSGTGSAQPAYNNFRRYTNGAWEARGAEFPDIPRIWVARTAATPDPVENATTGFRANVDILLKATV